MSADLQYPAGLQPEVETLSPAGRAAGLEALRQLPELLHAALAGLDDAQLDTPYRPGGWSVRQVAHHLPDSHLNAYVRTKLALTHHDPTILPYDQDAWAALPDSRGDVAVSVALLTALHERWTRLLGALPPEDWGRGYLHPQYGRRYTLDGMLASYAWHGRHHVAQITGLRERMGW